MAVNQTDMDFLSQLVDFDTSGLFENATDGAESVYEDAVALEGFSAPKNDEISK